MLEDDEWLRQTFLVPAEGLEDQQIMRREITDAQFKFTDTTLGGNYAINPPPQFTRFADIPVSNRFTGTQTSGDFQQGMGRYYSEAIDDRGQLVHMRFGVPQYNSLTNFFLNFYNPQASILANRGRSPDSFYYAGRAIGAGLKFVVTLPAQPFIWASKVIRFLANKPASRFYYMKPTMPLYWSAVQTMVNQIGVNMGIISRGMTTGDDVLRGSWDANQWTNESRELRRIFSNLYPDIYRADGGIDIYAVATRAQRLSHQNRQAMRKAIENSGSWGSLQSSMRSAMSRQLIDRGPQLKDMNAYLRSYHASTAASNDQDASVSQVPDTEKSGALNENIANDPAFGDHLQAELEDGSAFVTFRVNAQGEVSESFSNSTGESQIASTLNGISSTARTTRFSFADGNIDDGVIGKTIGGVVNTAKSVLNGTLEGLGLSGLMALTGSAKVDIPKVWEDSSVSLPTASYKIELRSPYGAAHARFQNLMVPMCMLLAAALPRSTGKQSYTMPFLCELYSKGRQQIRLGMIESLSITRGVGNLGWTREGEPLGIDIQFTVADMSSILHMPITSNFGVLDAAWNGASAAVGAGINALTGEQGVTKELQDVGATLDLATYDDDNAYSDYMATLGSLSLTDQIYPQNKMRLRKAQRAAEWESWKSPANWANWLGGSRPARLASMIIHAQDAPDLAGRGNR